jgi:hypothetical protein
VKQRAAGRGTVSKSRLTLLPGSDTTGSGQRTLHSR